MITKRKMEVNEDEIMDRVKKSMPKRSIMLSTSNVCSECKNPVFISERILFMKKLYHRTCFLCSNCKNPLNPHIADVSPDGSLFCGETNCHLELLKIFQQTSSKNVSLVSTPEIQKKKFTVPSFTNKQTSEIEDSNQNENQPELNLPKFPTSNNVDRIRAKFDTFDEDGHSQGDIQKPSERQQIHLNNHNKQLMDFAGALLHVDQIDSKMSSEILLESNPSVEADVSQIDEKANQKSENLEKVASEEQDISVKSTIEATSIKDKAVFTLADQIKKFAESVVEMKPETIDSSASVEIDSEDKLSGISIKSESDEQKILENSLLSHDIPKSLVVSETSLIVEIEKENIDTEILDSVESNISSSDEKMMMEEPENPIDNDEDSNVIKQEPEKLPETLPQIVTNVVPIPSPRLPRKGQEVSLSISPMPSPVPRTRVKVNKSQMNDNKLLNSSEELSKREDYYPAELNPFGEEEEEDGFNPNKKSTTPTPSVKVDKCEPKNPFEDDDDDEDSMPSDQKVPPSPKPRSSTPLSKANEINNNGIGKGVRSPGNISSQNAANFNVPPPRPPPPLMTSPRKTLVKPYNPFEDDDDIGEYEDDKPSGIFSRRSNDDTSSISSKTSDLSSISSVPTPIPRSLNTSDAEGTGSMKFKSRKSRRAPLPPSMNSSPQPSSIPILSVTTSVDNIKEGPQSPSTPIKKVIPVSPKLLRGLKTQVTQQYRKKRRAPPPRRRVDPLPVESIKVEFEDLDVRQKELERQGITLESNIRQLMKEEVDGSSENSEPLDEMIMQLWSIVNEKNDILRRQTELEYLRRGHRLEEMQSELEFKLRTLMDTPDDQKESNHADLEQLLLQQLLKLVDERNEVVEWLDFHRQLDREEDKMLSKSLSQFSSSKAVEPIPETDKKTKKKLKAEAKAKAKEESGKDKEKKKDGKLKLGIFSKKRKSKSNTDEDKSETLATTSNPNK